jgi:hypothetical protein
MNKILVQTKDYLIKNSWFFWLIIFLVIVSLSYSLRTGLLATGLIVNGILIGHLIPIGILVIQKKTDLKSFLLPLLLFIAITLTFYILLDNKAILLYTIPFCIPSLAAGLLSLRK